MDRVRDFLMAALNGGNPDPGEYGIVSAEPAEYTGDIKIQTLTGVVDIEVYDRTDDD